VPWCEECAKYYTPNSVEADGSCPKCGDVLHLTESAESTDEAADESTPWHFKLMVVAVVTYLGWRLIDLFV
jgi:hypothetical protein